jgi:hypothetical protein
VLQIIDSLIESENLEVPVSVDVRIIDKNALVIELGSRSLTTGFPAGAASPFLWGASNEVSTSKLLPEVSQRV